jgi:hypothetical protein
MSSSRTELPNITDFDVIMGFLFGTTCKELVQELGRNTPITANGLMDIITNFAAGEEAVGAIFGGDQDKGKHKVEDPASSSRGSKRNNRKKKKHQQRKRECREVFSVQPQPPSSLTGPRWPSLLTVMITQTTSPILGSTRLLLIPLSPTHASPRSSWMVVAA